MRNTIKHIQLDNPITGWGVWMIEMIKTEMIQANADIFSRKKGKTGKIRDFSPARGKNGAFFLDLVKPSAFALMHHGHPGTFYHFNRELTSSQAQFPQASWLAVGAIYMCLSVINAANITLRGTSRIFV
jgi:hypothetical protein